MRGYHALTALTCMIIVCGCSRSIWQGHIPVAWMLSNREDSIVLIEFFKVIKQRVGSLSPSWFMSDDAEQFFTAWRAVFRQRNCSVLGMVIGLGDVPCENIFPINRNLSSTKTTSHEV